MGLATRPPPIHLSVRLELPDRDPRAFEYDFEQPVVTLGRDPSNDIQVPLTTVSRHHARLFFERGDYFLEDLGSTHGTRHNDRLLGKGEKRLLRSGDRISIVSFHISFEARAPTTFDRQPGERTEMLARRMVQEVLQSLGSDEADRPSLRVMNGPDEGKRFPLLEDAAEVVIGRSPDCDVTLDDHNVSRRHCLVKRSWHGFTAQDLGSRNGVLVNGAAIEGPRELRDGDELQIGGIKIIFIDPPSRLLAQMGGPESKRVDEPETSPPTGAESPDAEHEVYRGAEDDLEPPAHSEPAPAIRSGPAELDEPPALSELPEEERRALEAAVEGTPAWDIAILVVGGLFLVAVLGFVIFLLI